MLQYRESPTSFAEDISKPETFCVTAESSLSCFRHVRFQRWSVTEGRHPVIGLWQQCRTGSQFLRGFFFHPRTRPSHIDHGSPLCNRISRTDARGDKITRPFHFAPHSQVVWCLFSKFPSQVRHLGSLVKECTTVTYMV